MSMHLFNAADVPLETPPARVPKADVLRVAATLARHVDSTGCVGGCAAGEALAYFPEAVIDLARSLNRLIDTGAVSWPSLVEVL